MTLRKNHRGSGAARRIAVRWGLVLLLTVPSLAARAAQPSAATATGYNEVSLQAEVTREVANDRISATLYAEAQDAVPAALQGTLNRIAAEALHTATGFKDVRAHTGAIQTYPVYDRDNKLSAWRGRTELRLESRDFAATAKLIARLQSSMQLGGVVFGVSPELRRQTERELLQEVVQAFRERADVLTHALGGKRYRLRTLAVQTGAGVSPRPLMALRAARADAEPAAPVLEAGTSRIDVGASGTIEVE